MDQYNSGNLCVNFHIQIIGKIAAAREALVEVTSRLRSYISQELLKKDLAPPSVSFTSPMMGVVIPEADSSKKINCLETHTGNSPVISTQQNIPTAEATQHMIVSRHACYFYS